MSRLTRSASGLFVLLCAAWYIRVTVVEVAPLLPVPADFNAYYSAAQNIVAGHSPYNSRSYIYPPFLAFALVPIAKLSYVAARWIWFLLSQASLLAAAWLMWAALGKDYAATCAVALVWAFGGAAGESLGLGQPGPELLLVAAVAITQPVARREWHGAAAIGIGAATKIFLIVLAALFLLRHRWRPVLVLGATLAALVALPWLIVMCCLSGSRTPGDRDTWSGTPSALSWGLPSVVLRAIDPPEPGGPLPQDWQTDIPYLRLPASHRLAARVVLVVTLLTGLFVLGTALRRSPPISQDRFAMAALVSLSLAASPVCWTHYQILQYPGVALLLCHAARSRRWGLLSVSMILGSLLYPLPVAVLADYYMKYGKWTASLPTFYFWDSIAPFASLGLFWLLASEINQAPSLPGEGLATPFQR